MTKNKTEMKNVNRLPAIMYIHGFRSGVNGSKCKQLKEHYMGKFRVITPEVDADPEKSLGKLNEVIALEKPEIIIGTSLGGWMAVMCDSSDAELVVVNPCVSPEETLSQWEGQELPYFCRRLDGVQTYTVTQDVLGKYKNYDFAKAAKEKAGHIYALCSTKDELLSDSHINTIRPLLPEEHLIVVDDFGHRCDCKGMTHLFGIMEAVIQR